jgi:hypothetical protein
MTKWSLQPRIRSARSPPYDGGLDLVACVFIYEVRFGDIMNKVEGGMSDWVDAHYGPFNGSDRIALRMYLRVTRGATCSPDFGGIRSLVEHAFMPTGHAAFCISYEPLGV